MRFTFTNTIIVLLCCLCTLSYSQSNDYVEGELLIKIKSNRTTAQKNNLKIMLRANVKDIYSSLGIELWKVPQVRTKADMDALINQYKNHPDIEFVEPNHLIRLEAAPASGEPDDPAFANQWALRNIGQNGGTPDADIDALEAWDITTESPSVVVAIIDTGIDWKHEDLLENIWQNLAEDADGDGRVLEWDGTEWVFDEGDKNGVDDDNNGFIDDFIGWDFRDNDNDPYDGHSHGTHVAGIVGAQGDNTTGIAGVTWNVQLAALKFFSDEGIGTSADAARALNYAIQMGMPISNNSWGGSSYNQTLYNAIDSAKNSGHIFVAAAGNEYGADIDTDPFYPASYDLDNIISVAATDHNDLLANYSNFGAIHVDLTAPGSFIRSCTPFDSYGNRSGTSMAAPLVAGACALLLEVEPNRPYTDLKAALLNSVDTNSDLTGKCQSNGRLNLYNTLTYFGLTPECRLNDSLTLLTLFNMTDGSNWINTWDINQPMDTWHGVTLNANGCVQRLDLFSNGLKGSIPTQLDNLNYVEQIWLYNNQLSGNIPPELGNLSNLTHLGLGSNLLTGSIPEEIGNLINLTHLALKNNDLYGCFSENLYNLCEQIVGDNITTGNNFLAPWSSFCSTQVGLCDLYSCRQSDSLALVNLYDATDGTNWTNTWDILQPMTTWHGIMLNEYGCVTQIDLRSNKLAGNIPPELGNLEALERLYLQDNQLTDTIPPELGNLLNLNQLWLFKNQLTGTIPPELANLGNLSHLGLGTNLLTGSIPPQLGNLSSLIHLGLQNNQLTGCFDFALMNLCSQLMTQNISTGNNFDVTWEDFCDMGDGICTLTTCRQSDSLALVTLFNSTDGEDWTNTWNLYDPMDTWHGITLSAGGCVSIVDLRDNELSGNIPPALGDLISLVRLYLHDNALTGSIPPDLGNLYSLEQLWLYGNFLTGNIPPELGNLSNLTRLGLTNNQLTGNLPSELGNLNNLIHLGVKTNQLSGCFEPNLQNLCGQLETYNIDLGNNFDGLWDDFCENNTGLCMPYICRQSDSLALVELYQSTNGANWTIAWNLNESIDMWYGVVLNENGCVVELRLSDNQLVGNLPPELGSLENLSRLYLYNNEISGNIPPELGNLYNLRQLWLFNNDLTGEIPAELGNLITLTHFGVGRNQLSGELPPDLGNLYNLIYLGLQANQLTGCYPPDLLNLCGQLQFSTNAYISAGNNFDADWEDFCAEDLGSCDLVFPGDLNFDGIVNMQDALYWGLAQINIGTVRSNSSTNFEGQHSKEWQQVISHVNGKHQDADGNGVVDEQDLYLILTHYGKSHAFQPLNFIASTINYSIEPLNTISDATTTTFRYAIYINDQNAPTEGHGMSFEINFDGIEVIEASMDVSDSSLNPERYIEKFDSTTNILGVAMTRTDRSNKLSNGLIGIVSAIVISEDVPNGDPFALRIRKGSMIKANGKIRSIGSMTFNDRYSNSSIQTNELSLSLSATHAQCLTEGSATAHIIGGIQPFDIQWSNGETAPQIYNLSPGIYTVSITDADTNTTTASIEIEGQYLPSYDENGNLIDCSIDYPVVRPLLYAYLEGPYNLNTGMMENKLQQQRLIPAEQPYSADTWNYNGIERIDSTALPTGAIDWVLVTFQTDLTPDTRIAEAAALLLEDGQIYFLNDNIRFMVDVDSVYINIRHRNHIAILTPEPVPINNYTLNYDFRLNESYRTLTAFGQKQLQDGSYAMYAGDAISDEQGYDINGQDKAPWSLINGNFLIYNLADFNLDGDINGADKGIWFSNNGVTSLVPK